MRNALFFATAAAAVLCAAGPVIAQQAPNPNPGPTNLAAPPPAATGNPVTPQPALTAPPLPSPIATAIPSASASASPGGKHKHHSAPAASPSSSAEATPPPPQFQTLDGDWEFVLSTQSDDVYGRLKLRQTGSTLAGTWIMEKKSYPVEGSYDGKAIRLTARRDNTDWTLSGYVDSASDMVGIVDNGKGTKIAFTANHREKAKQELLIKP